MKKLLTVSFIALISVISAGNAAIPDKTYVDDTAAQKVDVAQDVANAIMVTDESGNVVASTEVAESLNGLAAAVESAIGDIETLENADATNLQAAKDYANSLASNYDAFGSAAAAESSAKAYADGLAGNYDIKGAAATAESNAKAYADGLATNYDAAGSAADALADAKAYADQAEADAIAHADTELAKKVDKTGHTASQVVITDSTGAIATAAQIPNTQVSGLGDLATKSTIADADVAANAAIAQSKIAGLEDALAAKVDDSQVVATGGTVTSSDAQIPTIARMEAAISDATGNIDMSSKVDVTQSVKGGVLTTNADTGKVEVSATIAQDKVDGLASGLAAKVDVAQSAKNAFMVADVTGNVVPVPAGDCANTANKCALVTGVDGQGNLVLSWEVIARNVTTATE